MTTTTATMMTTSATAMTTATAAHVVTPAWVRNGGLWSRGTSTLASRLRVHSSCMALTAAPAPPATAASCATCAAASADTHARCATLASYCDLSSGCSSAPAPPSTEPSSRTAASWAARPAPDAATADTESDAEFATASGDARCSRPDRLPSACSSLAFLLRCPELPSVWAEAAPRGAPPPPRFAEPVGCTKP